VARRPPGRSWDWLVPRARSCLCFSCAWSLLLSSLRQKIEDYPRHPKSTLPFTDSGISLLFLSKGDSRINKFFADTAKDPKRLAKFKKNLVDQICQASGGPCKYTGKTMKAAHKGMGITDADFGALVEDLVKALDKFNVGATEKNELLGALGGMKGDIIGQ
jgi:hypothetical protein